MENCLVTKLKAIVNNDNLPILGFEKVRITGAYSAYANNIGFTARIKGTAVDCRSLYN